MYNIFKVFKYLFGVQFFTCIRIFIANTRKQYFIEVRTNISRRTVNLLSLLPAISRLLETVPNCLNRNRLRCSYRIRFQYARTTYLHILISNNARHVQRVIFVLFIPWYKRSVVLQLAQCFTTRGTRTFAERPLTRAVINRRMHPRIAAPEPNSSPQRTRIGDKILYIYTHTHIFFFTPVSFFF